MVRTQEIAERLALLFLGLLAGLIGLGGLLIWTGGAYFLTAVGEPYSNEKMVWDFLTVVCFVIGLVFFALVAWGGSWALKEAARKLGRPSEGVKKTT